MYNLLVASLSLLYIIHNINYPEYNIDIMRRMKELIEGTGAIINNCIY